jgi:hypothetical protein
MATVDKDFRVKHGLVVEGTTATVNGEDILTTGSTISTSDLTEGTNLFFTDQRAVDAVSGEIDTAVTTAVDALDTDAIEEGETNLYFTDQRAIDAVGGTATSENTADTVVKRDANGDFAAGTVTVSQLNIGEVGYIQDDGDIIIANTDGQDVTINAEDIRLNAADDVRLTAGTDGDIVLVTDNGQLRLEGPNIYAGENLQYVDSEKVATRGYVDDAIADIDLTYTTDEVTEGTTNLYFTNQRALDATSSAYDVAGAAATAQGNAEDYADGLAANYEVAGAAAAAQSAAESYADSAVSALVNGAPELLDTLNELAAAINDDASFASTIATQIGEKQNTLTAGSNIDITADTISVTGLDAADISDFDTAALSATASAYDAAGAAAAAQTAAESYADGLAVNYEAAGSAQSAVDALDTDDIEEGSNLYFTDERAIDAVSAADIYPNAVIVNNVSKTVANTQAVSTASTVSGLTWAKADYKSAKLVVKAKTASHSQVSEIMVTLDAADNVAITEFGIVYTDEELATVTADVSGTDVRIRVTTLNASTDVTVVGTLLL